MFQFKGDTGREACIPQSSLLLSSSGRRTLVVLLHPLFDRTKKVPLLSSLHSQILFIKYQGCEVCCRAVEEAQNHMICLVVFTSVTRDKTKSVGTLQELTE